MGIENLVLEFTNYLNDLNPEWVWLCMLLTCFGSVLLMVRYFGKAGIFVYLTIALIGANIQVLKVVQFSVFESPVALGTILFSSTYLCTDILNELYGPKEGRRAVMLGFAAMVLMAVLMILTIGFRPIESQAGLEWAAGNHEHIKAIMLPVPRIFIAGIIGYLLSQLYDVWLYNAIKNLTGERMLWLRNNVSTILSAFIDSIIFSLLAWYILAPEPIELDVIWETYILGTFGLRVILALLDTPILYMAKRIGDSR